jgi:hypothetical protein
MKKSNMHFKNTWTSHSLLKPLYFSCSHKHSRVAEQSDITTEIQGHMYGEDLLVENPSRVTGT